MARDVFEADDSVLNLVLDACKVCWSLILWMAISEETNFKNFAEENVSQKFSIEIL